MDRNDIISLCSLVAGIGALAADVGFKSELTSLFGVHTPAVLAGVGLAGTIASQVVRILSVPAGTQQQAAAQTPTVNH